MFVIANDSSILIIKNSLIFNENFSIKNLAIIEEFSRDNMFLNLFNFDFFNAQRFELVQIIIVVLQTNAKSFSNSFNFSIRQITKIISITTIIIIIKNENRIILNILISNSRNRLILIILLSILINIYFIKIYTFSSIV